MQIKGGMFFSPHAESRTHAEQKICMPLGYECEPLSKATHFIDILGLLVKDRAYQFSKAMLTAQLVDCRRLCLILLTG